MLLTLSPYLAAEPDTALALYGIVCLVPLTSYMIIPGLASLPLPAGRSAQLNNNNLNPGMPMGSHKKRGTFCDNLVVCVAHVQCSKGAKTEAPKGPRERNMAKNRLASL